ncbi:hypothetical protein VSH64_42740 [Amycolatopsis rhabdoformis]|uniref:DUF3558 domain-containing protein n=1 Tax=Amycolatopsis rhabdoformis TaxID=1448059 RepID=A0ABZ1I653_9PSEU|nr:hypothetical protein [Amycolatopsis rhabdoformis]WSE29451.1 hypothetical protein VSH64_42740 [Amycolatopsis rhabdoformis]
MRTRSSLVALGGVLLALTLAGCGSEAGPTPGPNPGTPGPDALPIKLDALSADACYASPQTQLPKGCEKYVTEVSGTAASVHERAAAGKTLDVALDHAAAALDQGVGAFRGAGCTTVPTAGGPCTEALVTISGALTSVKKLVNQQATTG